MEKILELCSVSKAFPKGAFKLENVSFSLPYGCIMGFVGENGAGKTTTIGCILNTVFADSGEIRLWGKCMGDRDVNLRENIGIVYDGDTFPGYLTARQLGRILAGMYTQWDNRLFCQYLQLFRLPEEQKIKTFSKGMAMKLSISAALAHHPKLLILDEATSGLDPVVREEMLEVFLDFVQKEDHSILLSSHITSDLEKVADYITFIHDGQIILTELKDDLLYRYAVVRCTEQQFGTLAREDMLAFRKRDLQVDVLVPNRQKIEKKYKNIIIDQVTVDEILLLLVKGVRV